MINPEVWKWAEWVSSKIDVPPEIIYSQWAMEQPDGVMDPAKYNYNIAGLTVSGVPGKWRKYNSLAEFAHDYVYSFIMPNYPRAMGAKTVQDFVTGLKYGTIGSYYGTESIASYGGKVAAVHSRLFGGSGAVPTAGQVVDDPPEEEDGGSWWDGIKRTLPSALPGVGAAKMIWEKTPFMQEWGDSIWQGLFGAILLTVGLVFLFKDNVMKVVSNVKGGTGL